MLRTLVIDDEPNARQVVKNILDQYCKSTEVIGEAENVTDGVKLINETEPDLVFLDIKMPDGTGFDLLKKVKNLKKHERICSTGACTVLDNENKAFRALAPFVNKGDLYGLWDCLS